VSPANRPSRFALSQHWLDYLGDLRDALLAASPQDELALRFEITIAENELVRRGLPPHALEVPDRPPTEPPETFSPRPLGQPGGADIVRQGVGENRPEIQGREVAAPGVGTLERGAGEGTRTGEVAPPAAEPTVPRDGTGRLDG
jgi:hypothetical protein